MSHRDCIRRSLVRTLTSSSLYGLHVTRPQTVRRTDRPPASQTGSQRQLTMRLRRQPAAAVAAAAAAAATAAAVALVSRMSPSPTAAWRMVLTRPRLDGVNER
jgi:hypothetical protein